MIDEFLNFEMEYSFLHDSVDNFYYWFYIRNKIYAKIFHLGPNISNNNLFIRKIDTYLGLDVLKLINPKIKMNDIISVVKNITINKPYKYVKHKKILLFPSPRRTLINGKYYAYWTDELADYYADDSISAEFLNITNHSKPYWNNNVIDMDLVDIVPVLMSKINFPLIQKSHDMFLNKCRYIINKIFKYFGIELELNYLLYLISTRYIWWLYKNKILRKFIEGVSPKVIVEIMGYSTNSLIINEIAHDMKICTIELQHGIMGYEHIGYNYKENIKQPCLPNKLLTFSKYWKNTCRFPIGSENIIPVGYPYAEMQKKKYPKITRRDAKVRILVLSQPVYYEEFLKTVKQFIDILEEKKYKYIIYFKLHPTEYNHPVSLWNLITNGHEVRVINNPEVSLYELFANSDIQIGATSTAIFEGLIYNLFTIICNFKNAKQTMKDLCEMGYAHFANDAVDIAHLIINRDKYINKKTKPIHDFFEKNASHNIHRLIDQIIDKR